LATGKKGSRGSTIGIEALTTEAQFRDAVALQKTVWGFDEIELVPVRLFVVATKVGGQAFGAYDDGRMVAFCLALPGLKPGPKSFLHSQMLGVLPAYRDAGIGRRLKLKQREDALARGIDLIEWTFDPLEIKNAYFNMERLGAVVRRYVRNQYGTTTSHLHGGLPTDRCTAEWWVGSERVRHIVNGEPFENPPIQARIQVPATIGEIRRHDPKRARTIQAEVSEQFEAAFDKGLAVVGVDRSPEWGTYLLGELP
jgi:predicted GNAT superfamily acetyltransferase